MFAGKLGRVGIVLMGAVGVALLGAWLLSAAGPETVGTSPASLTFISPIGNPQFGLRKVVDNSHPAPGNQINYTLFYRNTNQGSQAFNVRLYDILPTGAQLVSSSPPAT